MIKLKGNTIYLTKEDTLDLKVNEFIPGEGEGHKQSNIGSGAAL